MSTPEPDQIPPNVFGDIAASAARTAQESVATIGEIAKSVDAASLFVAMFANMAFGPAESISEATHGTVPAQLELLAYHLFPFFGVSKETGITPFHTQQCWEVLDKLLTSQMQYRAFSTFASKGSDPVDSILRSARIDAELVRGSAYPEQTKEEILSVQGHFDSWYSARVGIAPSRAVKLLWNIMAVQEEKANKIFPDTLASGRFYGDLWEKAKKKALNTRSEIEQKILNECNKKETAQIFGYVEHLNGVAPLGLPVSLNEITNIEPPFSEEEWNAVSGMIGISTEARKAMRDPVEARHRPLFVLPDSRVLLADISNALDCLWENFERLAKADQTFYDKNYQRRKANWVENKVSTLLSQIFPATHVYHRLIYPDPDKSPGSTTELDFAILWPPFIVLVEAKAKQFRIESRLGDLGRLRSDIQANVEDAYEQAKRASRYISRTDRPHFIERSTDRKLEFNKTDIYRIYLLTVSQHHLAGLVNRFSELQGMGLFKSGEYPLSVCIADLEMIAEFCTGPDVFLHYIERRLVTLHEKVHFIGDELDFFGAYLSCRLQAERLWKRGGKTVDGVTLSGWSDKFDKFMGYKRGERKDWPSIELQVPDEIKNILSELRKREDDAGARWIAFSLLGMSDEALGAIAKSIREVKEATLTPGMFRRTAYRVGDTVISIVASLDIHAEVLRERTHFRALLEKYRHKATKSIGIGIMVADKTKPFDCAIWAECPWNYDEEIQKAIDAEPPFILTPGQKLPGRNQPCICGSGKKFKKCCEYRIQMK